MDRRAPNPPAYCVKTRPASAYLASPNRNPPPRPASASDCPMSLHDLDCAASPSPSPSSSITTASEYEDATNLTEHEAWVARVEKERQAEEKLIAAVCAASLLEYTERERAQSDYEKELQAQLAQRTAEIDRLRQRREDAEQKKRAAVQRVIDAKKRAASMKAQAQAFAHDYEAKAVARVETESEAQRHVQQTEAELALAALQRKKDEAMQRRAAAEKRAAEAQAKAEAMRQRAIQAAQVLRQQSRGVVEHQLEEEERGRRFEQERQQLALTEEQKRLRGRTEAASKKAEVAAQRAEELQHRAREAQAQAAMQRAKGKEASPVA